MSRVTSRPVLEPVGHSIGSTKRSSRSIFCITKISPLPALLRPRKPKTVWSANKSKKNKSMPAKRSRKTSKRTIIEPRKGDRRYVRRRKTGQFKKEVNVGRSLAADRRRKAKTKAAKGQGDRGDTKRESVVKRIVRKLTAG